MDKVKGLITESMYLEMSEDFLNEKQKFEQLIAQTEDNILEINNRMQNEEDRKELIEKYLRFDHLERNDIKILVDRILVGKKDPETKQIPVEIYWNF